ncbi:N-acetylmuramic acid 6-phosphate etherase [Pontibacillus litoralis]|uniref:N-acetylmuramic acid 6-phosphate etherase n=1 Tax=Pontibacillus litoralis JSM 072002 TaxID=1385512 RepID=A0A0A5G0P1_9BACI|nr:N-acetylmuramic acid 6-phosphate etherase [Pontibacillus litoralis]KGX84630.1 N-acetylmuramic acid-6-phosphate etherase [Pontibacillus litoralis JSM 072002]
MKISNISTEKRNNNTLSIDQATSLEIVSMMNEEDTNVPNAIKDILPAIAEAIDGTVDRMKKGGRLIYIGAGTSGRLGILDAVECPPTFSTSNEVQAVIAGGNHAMFKAFEGAEDDEEQGAKDLIAQQVNAQDIVVGIAASGRTPYTIGGMKEAKKNGAFVIAVVCSHHSEMAKIADIPLEANVGPEVIAGSTRLKAGTAQKLILNMLSTGTMIKLGKVYSNLMVDLKPSNYKLKVRSINIIIEATGASEEEARKALETYGTVKGAIVSMLTNLEGEQVFKALEKHHGHIQNIIKEVNNIK